MIIESLISDASKVTLDCAKATLAKGSKIEILDEFYGNTEVQNAIKMGMIKVVGTPPALPLSSRAEDKMLRFRNVYKNKLAFECVRAPVAPGEIIFIPTSKVTSAEVRNAIEFGMLEDVDAVVAPPPKVRTGPVALEEMNAKDIVESKPIEGFKTLADVLGQIDELSKTAEKQAAKPLPRPKKKADPALKAKPISRRDSEVEAGEDGALFKPSQVRDPEEKPAQKPKADPKPNLTKTEEKKEADRFSFLDIFGKDDA